MQFDEMVSLTSATRRNDHDYRCKCPAHNGKSDDSLSITPGDNGVALLYCHAGCTYQQITDALGHKPTPKQTETSPKPKSNKKPTITAVYAYTDENGDPLFEKIRYEPKSFRVRVKNGSGYDYKLGDTRRVLYNLPAVIASDTVWVCEGEKDVDRLANLGIVATCNFDGASKGTQSPKWLPEYNPFFDGKTVYILPDNDEPGDAHARHIKQQLVDIAESVKIVELPDLQPAGDVSDWLNEGHTVDELVDIASQKKPFSHKWKIKTFADAYEELTPTEYIIDPILPRRSLSIWFGAPGSLKSMILMDMVVSIRAESVFVPGGNVDMQCKKSNVLWLDLDNGDDVLRERFAAMGKSRNIKKDDNGFHYVSMPKPWLFVSDVNSQMDLRTIIEGLNIDLVVIDNLGTITGEIDENSAAMVKVMAPLREMTADLDASIILIHHQRKGGSNGARAGDALRGHSVIEASLDYAILISHDETNHIVNVKCTKARRFRFDDFKAQYNYEHKSGTNDLDIAWFSSPAFKRGTNPVYDAIMAVLEANIKMTQERLKDAVYDYLDHKYSKTKIHSWIKEMSDTLGIIGIDKGPYNANLMYLKGGK